MLTNHDIAHHRTWRDNVFVERLWRSAKYEEVYLRAYETVGEARASIGRYLDFYNGRRPHSSLDGRDPDQAYFNSLPLAWQPKPGRASLIDAEILFQTSGTSSFDDSSATAQTRADLRRLSIVICSGYTSSPRVNPDNISTSLLPLRPRLKIKNRV